MMKYSREQAMLTLSLVPYLGGESHAVTRKTASKREVRTRERIEEALRRLGPLDGAWELAWGPAAVRFPVTVFADNLVFVVRHRSEPGRYVVAVRGPSPLSTSTWLLEDWAALRQVAWPYDDSPLGLTPKIAYGAAMSLEALQGLLPMEGSPGQGTTLYRFLADEMKRSTKADPLVSCVGHSLGGALSALVALWLADTRRTSDEASVPPWDPTGKARLEVCAFASPSVGNKDFVEYYERKLGSTTSRVVSPLDVLSRRWEEEMVAKIESAYAPAVEWDWHAQLMGWAARKAAAGKGYQPVGKESVSLNHASVSGLFQRGIDEMIFQHTVAYLALSELPGRATDYFELSADVVSAIHAKDPSAELGKNDAGGLRSPHGPKLPLEEMALRVLHRVVAIPASIALPIAGRLPLAERQRAFKSKAGATVEQTPPAKPAYDNAPVRPNGPPNGG